MKKLKKQTKSKAVPMPSPYIPSTRRFAFIQVIGKGWYNQTMAMDIPLSDHDLESIGEFTKSAVDNWLGSHSGDFQSITDFRAQVGAESIEWESEESEFTYSDIMFLTEE